MRAVILLCCLAAVAWAKPSAEKYVPGEYIVRVNDFASLRMRNELIRTLKLQYGYELKRSFDIGKLQLLVLKGTDENMEKVAKLPMVRYIERNNIGGVDQCAEQPSPGTWGLDRVDQTDALTYSDPTSPDATYNYGEDTGVDTSVYVLDTGIEIEHSEFTGGRARWGFSADGLEEFDDHGHGTHCAGTVGGTNYGVAKGTEVVAVKVINWWGGGTTEQFLQGTDWILSDHQARREANGGVQVGSVVSISLGYSPTQSIDDAVNELSADGVVIVTSAGNSDDDACGQSPARASSAIAIGASDVGDVSASFSNYGSCVDLYAPGVDVLSAQPGDSTAVFSGTSMACPHVAGAAARYISSQAAVPAPDAVRDYLRATATVDALTWHSPEHGASENLLLYTPCPL